MKVLFDLSFIRLDLYTGVAKYAYRILDYVVLSNQYENFKLLLNVASERQIRTWYPQFGTIVIGRRGLLKIPVIRTLWCMFEFPKTVNRSGCDIVFCPYGGSINCLNTKVKKITTVHDLQLQVDLKGISKILPKIWDDTVVKNSDVIVTISEFSKNQILSFYPELEGRVFPLGNSISVNEKSSVDLQIAYRYILYVGRLSGKKNVLTLLKAFNGIKDKIKDRKLVIIGKTNSYWENTLFPYIENQGLSEKIILVESCSEEELTAWYKRADLFVFPSIREGFGSPPLEAAILEVPVITSLADSLEEVTMGLLNSYNNPMDDEELSKKILTVLTNPPSKECLKEIRRKLLAKYSPEIVGQRICNFIYNY